MKRIVYPVVMVLMLTACSGDGMDDLREFIATAHADLKPTVEPIPEMKPYEPFAYSAMDLPDPFASRNLRPLMAKAAPNGPRPDMNRRREALEDYPLDALKMVGTLFRKNQRWAIIRAPDGVLHRAQVGNYMGQNFGKVLRISDEKIDLLETVAGPSGDWVEREASVAIVE